MNRMLCIFACVLLILLGSCATKSGRSKDDIKVENRNTKPKGESKPRQPESKNNFPAAQNTVKKYDGREIFKKYNSAVFMIYTSDGTNGSQGSGFFINSDGIAVSNYHVFQGTRIGLEQIKLYDSNNVYKCTEVIAKSEELDFIIFKVNASNTNYVPISKKKPSVGDKVFAIGSPLGFENTFSSGEVSQWREHLHLLQISVPIDHGSSGGVLIDEYGNAVGITTSGIDDSGANLNFAIDINVIKPYIKGYIE